MSIEPDGKTPDAASGGAPSLDLSGLPTPVVSELRRLVATLRESLGNATSSPPSEEESPEDWQHRLQSWVDRHPVRCITLDDSRASLYAGRGE